MLKIQNNRYPYKVTLSEFEMKKFVFENYIIPRPEKSNKELGFFRLHLKKKFFEKLKN